MSGASLFDTLGLSFADTSHQSSAISSPVIFGAMAFGRGTAGGNSTAANPSTSSDGGATAVTPQTSLGLGGGGGTDPLSSIFGGMGSVSPFVEATMGLNGGQIQDPLAKLALYGQLPLGLTAGAQGVATADSKAAESIAPSPIAIGAIVLALGGAAFFLLR